MTWRGALVSLLVPLALCGCVTRRSTYREEIVHRRAVEADLRGEQHRASALDREVEELGKQLERRELERSSLGKERVDLLNELEDLRQRLEQSDADLQEEQRHRQERDAAIEELSGSYHNLVEQLEGEVQTGQLEIQRLRDRLRISAVERILFDSGSTNIKREGQTVLAKVAEQLRKVKGTRIQVEGHTDDVPISSARFSSNWELSAARATRVLRFLIEKGVAPGRLTAVGVGPHRPIADNGTPAGRARNRRIEIILVPQEEG